jgi:tRNA dimethylallyltransferase
VPHHVIDVVEPDETFDAARFRRLALAAVEDVARRGRVPIVCGGTGLYVRALLEGIFDGAPASPILRAELYALEEHEGAGTLHRLLQREDAPTASRLHARDLPRIVRALEVGRVTGRPMSAWQEAHGFRDRRVAALVLGCLRSREELAVRVEARCRAMIDAGLLAEIAAVWARGFGPGLPSLRSVGYLEMGRHLRGESAFDTAFDAFVRATCRLGKRQRTWFRGQTTARWFHPEHERAALFASARSWREQAWRGPISTSSDRSPS